MRHKSLLTLSLCVIGRVSFVDAVEEAVRGVPFKPDPPFAIDGDLGDWSEVPNVMVVGSAEQVVWGPGAWRSLEDLSGTARVAWRADHLFFAVDVVDDTLSQTQRGQNVWKGDHIEVYLDVQPELEPRREILGEGQFQLAFSPGNFLATGDPLADCAPEAYVYRPKGVVAEGVSIAASQRQLGWAIEAAVPWALLGVDSPVPGMALRFEIAISDTDSPTPQQESMMTVSTAQWAHNRSRMMLAALAGADGVPTPVARGAGVFDELELANGAKKEFAFTAPPVPEGRDALLVLRARLDTAKVAGHTPSLRLTLNAQTVGSDRLVNKPLRARARNGRVYSLAAGDRFTVYYSPDFKAPDQDPYYALLGGLKACDFELNVTDLVREGENVLVVEHAAAPTVDNPLIAADAAIAFRVPIPPPKPRAGPPTGPLPRVEPRAELETPYTVNELPDGQIEVSVGGESFVIESRFSTPEPKWVTGSSRFAQHRRRLERKPEAIVVHDTFTNLTGENLALMRRYQARLGDRQAKLWLTGLEQPTGSGAASEPANPTSFATTARHGLGFVALDDVFRIHATNYGIGGDVGLADNNLVLVPGATYAAEWAIVPTTEPDYWRFINAVRRLVDANFTIDGAFAFLRADPLTDVWTDAQVADFIRFKDAKYVCASITYPRYKGRYAHGTAFQQVTHDNFRNAFERRRRLAPEALNLVYFHCFLDVTDDAPERFPDARTLGPDGNQADYGKVHQRLFFPTESNSYGREIVKTVDIILDEIGAEGVYWDEHEYSRSRYHYGAPWDSYSGDIDPQRMTVSRLKSSVTLLSEPWRVALGRRILERGPLIGNGAPVTSAMRALKFPCFIETGSISNCRRSHLYSPIALGDHLTERSEEDAYRVMLAALDYGCVYHWYNDVNVIPTHHHLTRYMYPITPMELHEGYIIGEERIVTKRSGLYGWGDTAEHGVHVFDDEGREVADFDAPLVRHDGNTYTELRIGEDWSAAIVRK